MVGVESDILISNVPFLGLTCTCTCAFCTCELRVLISEIEEVNSEGSNVSVDKSKIIHDDTGNPLFMSTTGYRQIIFTCSSYCAFTGIKSTNPRSPIDFECINMGILRIIFASHVTIEIRE